MKTLLLAITLGLLACAHQLTEEEAAKCNGDDACLVKALEHKKADREYYREEREIEFREKYYRDHAACKANGGIMRIVRHSGVGACRFGRGCPPKWLDSYSCHRP